MAAPTLTQIRVGIAANLSTLVGSTQLQVSAYMLANPTPPAIHVYPTDIDYDLTMRRGLDKWSLTVQAFVPLAEPVESSQALLDAFLAPSGATSVKKAIEADQTLGGVFTLNPGESPVSVVSCTGYRVYARDGGAAVLGAEWVVEVLASGI